MLADVDHCSYGVSVDSKEIGMSDILVRPSKIAQWGNSAAVRLGAAMLEHAHLHLDDPVDIIARGDEIIIRRQRPRITMTELLAQFDPQKHRHDLAFDVEPAGTETT
jgi:antitoxin component of MazEF toxin-antitoxin module